MDESTSLDDVFRVAVSAIDAGDITELSRQIAANPRLVSRSPRVTRFVAA